MKRIAVLTSGGDSPGMNAAIRAVVRTASFYNIQTFGVFRGYEGLIDGEMKLLKANDVSNIIQRGGTILKSARSKRFYEKKYRKQAIENLLSNNIEGLVVIGGNGSYKGAAELLNDFPDAVKIVGLPGTIDNDLYGTDFTIGYDTAINTAMYAIDKIRDTANAFNRMLLVEVMGRDAGFIALRSGIGIGAEAVLIPESKADLPRFFNRLQKGWKHPKSSFIVVVSEGDEAGGAFEVKKKILEKFPAIDARVTILGHIQRGGSPTCMDRVRAAELGVAAVEALKNNETGIAIGIVNKKINKIPFEKAVKHHKDVNPNLLHLLEILS